MKPYCLLLPLALAAQPPQPDAPALVVQLGNYFKEAPGYLWEGELVVGVREGVDAFRLVAQAKVRMAGAPGGKSYFRLEPRDKDPHFLISDGQKSWAFVPRLKQYTESESATVETGDAGDLDDDGSDAEVDPAQTFAQLIWPTLTRLHRDASAADFHGTFQVKLEGKKYTWPVLRVMTKPDTSGNKTLLQFVLDPATRRIGRMVLTSVIGGTQTNQTVQMELDFSSFRADAAPPDDTFRFDPPKNARLVEFVPIPGQTGSALLHRLAPDFELKTLDGDKIRLSELRGRPVLLNFWASWCGPCRRELPVLTALHHEFQDRGLFVFGVNDEGRSIAREFLKDKKLDLPTLDDSSRKAHSLYRVNSIPSVFLIDRDGRVVKFLRGARDESGLRSALEAVYPQN